MNNRSTAIGTVVLAAGESSRLGQPKQLLPYNGTTLLGHTLEQVTALSVEPRILVLGAHAAAIADQVDAHDIQRVTNEEWKKGMAASLKAGLKAASDAQPNVESILFTLCDQPYLSSSLLKKLLTAHRAGDQLITACRYTQGAGVPMIIRAELFDELMTLSGDIGAKPLLQKYPDDVQYISFPKGAVDIDTPEEYEALQSKES